MYIKSIGSKLRTTLSLSDKLDCAPPPPPHPHSHTHTHGKDCKLTGLKVDITNKNMFSEKSAYSVVEETQHAFGLLLMHHFLLRLVHCTACEHFPVNQNCSISKDPPPPPPNKQKTKQKHTHTRTHTHTPLLGYQPTAAYIHTVISLMRSSTLCPPVHSPFQPCCILLICTITVWMLRGTAEVLAENPLSLG